MAEVKETEGMRKAQKGSYSGPYTELVISNYFTMPYKADDMKVMLPNKSITRLEWEPNYDSINALCMQLYGNAGTIPTGLGDG